MQVSGLNNTQVSDFSVSQRQHENDVARFEAMFAEAMERRGEAEEVDRAAIRNAASVMRRKCLNPTLLI